MTVAAVIANNNNISDGGETNADTGNVLSSSSSYDVLPRNGWDRFSEALLLLSWIGVLVYFIQTTSGYEMPPQSFELTLLVMLVVLNLIVGSRLLQRMLCQQQQRACMEEADDSVVERPSGRPQCLCDCRSLLTLVLSLGWWFFGIRRYYVVKWGLWRGLYMGLNWRGGPTSLSIGFLVGAVMIQFVTWALNSIHRKFSTWTLFNGGLKCVNRKHSCFDPKLAATMPFVATTAGTLLLLLSISGFIVSYLRRVDAIEPMLSFVCIETPYADKWCSTHVYNGAAYIRNVTVEDLEDQMENCKNNWDKNIHVDVDVYFGGSWACPFSPDTQCETTVQAEARCKWLNIDIRQWDVDSEDWGSTVNDIEDATVQDYYDAIQRHYHNHNNKNIGNDDYNPYGFDDDDAFDPDSAPPSRGQQWYAFTESIFGNCGTCEAMSESTFRRLTDEACRASTDAQVFLGAMIAAVCCLVAVFVVPKKKSTIVEEPTTTPFASISNSE